MGNWKKTDAKDLLKGLRDIEGKIQKRIREIEAGAGRGLVEAGAFIMSKSVPRAPVDKGPLRRSAFLRPNSGANVLYADDRGNVALIGEPPENVTSVDIGYAEEYAVVQHEHTEFDHPSMARQKAYGKEGVVDPNFTEGFNGEAKFLENPLRENQNKIVEIVARRAKESGR